MTNEEFYYRSLKDYGYKDSMICGILANIAWESNYKSSNLEQRFEKKLKLGDVEYTAKVDLGEYTEDQFVNDSAGYGIAQWTWKTRKKMLYDYARKQWQVSIGNPFMQIAFLVKELNQNYKTVLKDMMQSEDTIEGARYSAKRFCQDYEAPPEIEKRIPEREATAERLFKRYHGE